MRRQIKSKLGFCGLILLSALLGWGCPTKGNVKADKTPAAGGTAGNNATGAANPNAPRGCVKGRVVNEEGKGFSGVLISTNPATSPEVTDSNGFFELCNQRKVVNAETGETAKVPINFGRYKIKFSKDGFHARPIDFDYNGQMIRLKDLVMVEKTRPLPDVVETKQKETQRDSGGGGKAPISE